MLCKYSPRSNCNSCIHQILKVVQQQQNYIQSKLYLPRKWFFGSVHFSLLSTGMVKITYEFASNFWADLREKQNLVDTEIRYGSNLGICNYDIVQQGAVTYETSLTMWRRANLSTSGDHTVNLGRHLCSHEPWHFLTITHCKM